MKTHQAIRALSANNPLPEPATIRARKRNSIRAASIAICASVILSVTAVGYTNVTGQRHVVTTWSSTAITDPSTPDMALIDVHDSTIATMLTQLQQRYPLPPGRSSEAIYASMNSAFPMNEGSDWPTVSGRESFDPFYYLGFVPTDGPGSPPAYVRARDVAGNVAVLAANSWYRYWLDGTPTERLEAEAVIKQMPTWADLVWRVEDGGNPYRVGIVLSLVKAIADGDEATVREWFKDHKWLPRPGG